MAQVLNRVLVFKIRLAHSFSNEYLTSGYKNYPLHLTTVNALSCKVSQKERNKNSIISSNYQQRLEG